MIDGKSAGLESRRRAYRSALLLGGVVAVVLGVLRGVAQVIVQQAYAYPVRMVWTLVLACVIWLPIAAAVEAVLGSAGSPRRRRLMLALLAVVVSAIEPVWFFGVLARIGHWRPRGGYWINSALRLDTNLLIFAAIAGWLALREMERRRALAAQRAALLRSRASGAALDVLTLQLQPHFLFNTLNLVSQLAFESALRARRAIANLRSLLAESVAADRPAAVSLGEELRFLEAYLDLQRDRFGARLDARVVADVDLLGARIPRMLLQPIVENAIRHGIAPRKSGGAVHVRVRRAPGGRVSIDVSDDGVGLRGEAVREGMGLANARHRLEQLHPGAILIDLSERAAGGVTTRIEFPMDAAPSGESPPPAVEDDVRDDVSDEPARDAGVGLRATVMVLGWGLVAAVWTELESVVPIALGQAVPWASLFAKNSLIAGVWIALTPLTLRLTDALAGQRRGRRIAAHALGAAVFTAAHLAATSALMALILHADGTSIRVFQNGWAVWDIVAYVTLVAFGEVIAARARLREQRVETSRAMSRLAAARVALLRLHLQPSLLLSAVDAVDAAIGDPVRCESAIARLGDMLRMLLATSGNEETTLDAELALLESYCAVVGTQLSVALGAGGDARSAVPSAVLAPLLASVKPVAVHVDVALRSGMTMMELAIQGDASLDADVLARTKRRLAALYGDAHTVRFIRRDGNASVVLEFPHRVVAAATLTDRRAIA